MAELTTMGDDLADLRAVARLALLMRAAVDISHPRAKGLRVVGWIIEPDEHYRVPEGVDMLAALQRLPALDLSEIRRGLRERMDAPLDPATYAETTV